jgi:two-component system sensor histidine kinase UhpB
MTTKDARIILIEDDPMFSQMIHFQLTSISSEFSTGHIQHATSIKDFEDILSFFLPDLILLDLNLPDSKGLDTYMIVKNKCPNSAIIILSGSDDEDLAAKIVQNGAQDYILKSDVNGRLLNKSVQYSLERMRQQLILAESERKFREVFENSPIPMLTVRGPIFTIQMANKAFSDLYEGQLGEFNGKTLEEFNWRKEENFYVDMRLTNVQENLQHRTKNNKQIFIELTANKLHSQSDMYICLIIDKTEELKFQEEKFKLISAAQENEKHKIAREIHDGLAQNLVLMNLLFEGFEFNKEQQDLKDNFKQLIQSTIEEAKGISYSLLPPELESGLLSGLRNMISRINYLKSQEFVLNIGEGVTESDFDTVDRFNLFRVIQEFSNNSIKHSQSKELTMNINKDNDGKIHLTLSDNGVGFDQSLPRNSLGIENMLNRIKLANLEGSIQSEIGKGTTLDIAINTKKQELLN